MDIVEEIRRNRESGAKRLVSEYKAGLMTLARRFCHDYGDAEELVNRTFAAVVEEIDEYLEQSAFFAWMCQILTNIHATDVRRKSHRNEVYPGTVPEVADEDAQEEIYRNLDHSLLHDAIESLPQELKEVIVMHYLMGESVAKVAKFVGQPASTVKWRLHVARKALASKLGVAAKKSGAKAVLLALTLACTAALGAGIYNLAVSGEGQETMRAAAARGVPDDSKRTTASGRQQADNSKRTTASGQQQEDDGKRTTASGQQQEDDGKRTTASGQQQADDSLIGETMNATTRTAALGAATALALAATPSAASGDEYQFIISGDMAAAATAGRAAGESANGPLDVRHHAVAESRAMALSSIKNNEFVIVVR